MLDPFPIAPPAFLVSATKPLADTLHLHSLPLHVHEVLFAAALYTFTEKVVSPWISNLLARDAYQKLTPRGRLNWDVHVVSFVQSCLINALSLYIIWFDKERAAWRYDSQWDMRIWGYYGSGGLVQSFALGYFLWDLYMCSMHVEIFGWGMLAHAISAVSVFALGYRPFIYFYAPVFLLYELSSPFLNVHWFCDKLGMTGSTLQAVNGGFLVLTFFGCRIVWGLYSSVNVFKDVWQMIIGGHTDYGKQVPLGRMQVLTTREMLEFSRDAQAQLTAFNREEFIPLWIPVIYLASNVVLNSLNIFWFGKMIETIRTRFDPPWGTKGVVPVEIGGVLKREISPRNPDGSIPQLNPEGATIEEDVDLQVDGEADADEKPLLDGQAVDGVSAAPVLTEAPHTPKKKGGSVSAARARAEAAVGPVGTVQDTKVELPNTGDSDSAEVTGSARRSVRSRRKA